MHEVDVTADPAKHQNIRFGDRFFERGFLANL